LGAWPSQASQSSSGGGSPVSNGPPRGAPPGEQVAGSFLRWSASAASRSRRPCRPEGRRWRWPCASGRACRWSRPGCPCDPEARGSPCRSHTAPRTCRRTSPRACGRHRSRPPCGRTWRRCVRRRSPFRPRRWRRCPAARRPSRPRNADCCGSRAGPVRQRRRPGPVHHGGKDDRARSWAISSGRRPVPWSARRTLRAADSRPARRPTSLAAGWCAGQRLRDCPWGPDWPTWGPSLTASGIYRSRLSGPDLGKKGQSAGWPGCRSRPTGGK